LNFYFVVLVVIGHSVSSSSLSSLLSLYLRRTWERSLNYNSEPQSGYRGNADCLTTGPRILGFMITYFCIANTKHLKIGVYVHHEAPVTLSKLC